MRLVLRRRRWRRHAPVVVNVVGRARYRLQGEGVLSKPKPKVVCLGAVHACIADSYEREVEGAEDDVATESCSYLCLLPRESLESN